MSISQTISFVSDFEMAVFQILISTIGFATYYILAIILKSNYVWFVSLDSVIDLTAKICTEIHKKNE